MKLTQNQTLGGFLSNSVFYISLRLLREDVNFKLIVANEFANEVMEQYLKIFSERTNDLRKDSKTLLHK